MLEVGDRVKSLRNLHTIYRIVVIRDGRCDVQTQDDFHIYRDYDINHFYKVDENGDALPPEELQAQPERQEFTFYSLIAKNPRGNIFMLSYPTERETITVKATYEQMGDYEVLATKKIKVRV